MSRANRESDLTDHSREIGSVDQRVAVWEAGAYPREALRAPYRPATSYPELAPVGVDDGKRNSTYDAVRSLLFLWAGLDAAQATTRSSPLETVIQPGMRIAIKPNLVLHKHPMGDEGLRATVTDAAVIRPVLDYVAKALRGDGMITVADSPLRMTDFAALVTWMGLDRILEDVARTWNIDVELLDLRDQTVADEASFGHNLQVRVLPGDPRGGLDIDLGRHSALEAFHDSMSRLRSTAAVGSNEAGDVHHRPGHHQYHMARSVLDADLIISMPKLKTHKKAGVTCGIKNYVGSVIRKEWLPHHRKGSPSSGGDEYADSVSPRLKLRERAKDFHLQSRIGKTLLSPVKWMYRRTIQNTPLDFMYARDQGRTINGGWSGNDTCWRMVHDLYRAVLYAGSEGTLCQSPQRQQLTIVDGLIAGEGDGPLVPSPRQAGVLMAGADAVWVDYFATLIMGYDPLKIPQIARAVDRTGEYPLTALERDDVRLLCSSDDLRIQLSHDGPSGDAFVPPIGWARLLAGEEMYQRAVKQQSCHSFDY